MVTRLPSGPRCPPGGPKALLKSIEQIEETNALPCTPASRDARLAQYPRPLQSIDGKARPLFAATDQLTGGPYIDDRVRGQKFRQPARPRSDARIPRRLNPSRLQMRDLGRELTRTTCRSEQRIDKHLVPVVLIPRPPAGQAGDVSISLPCQHKAHRGQALRGDVSSTQDDEDQRPADTAISVKEGMDRLELDVRDCRLNCGGQVRAIAKGAEVIEQTGQELGWRWHELGISGA